MNSREKAHAATSANEGGLTSKTIDHPHLSEQMGTNECKTAADWSFTDMSVPSVTLKIAVDRNWAVDDLSDGPKRFTSQASLDAVHRIRRDCDAVIVGVGTVVRDDPSLTVRRVPLREGKKQPTRVVLDRTVRLPENAACLRDGHPSIVFFDGCEPGASRTKLLAKQAVQSQTPVEFVGLTPQVPGGIASLPAVLQTLRQRGILHVLVEGGPSTVRNFLSDNLVDRAVIVRAPMEFSRPVPSLIDNDTLRRAGLEYVSTRQWGEDKVDCWSRPGLHWPCGGVQEWP